MYNYNEIKSDIQIKKFSMYGFFKNLKFFEPYLYLYLLSLGHSLFFIGLLFSIREAIVYIFEIPSGVFADYFGKKKELMLCFLFYMASFLFFFIGTTWGIVIAMIFYGLGEAFRSGTHKAMIISYLEMKSWTQYKTFVYGRTRSFSLLGSALSSLLAIFIVIYFTNIRFIFLITIIPYVIDFILIYTYPDSLDEPECQVFEWSRFKEMGFEHMKSLKHNTILKSIILSSSVFDGFHKTIKDYIQPIVIYLFFLGGVIELGFNQDNSTKVILGVMYFIFYMSSSYLSKNLYKITEKFHIVKLYNLAYLINGVLCITLVLSIHFQSLPGVLVSFLCVYLMKDGRRPLFVELSSEHMKKNERATMLSIESQIRAVLMIIISPLFGGLVDIFGIEMFFIFLGSLYIILYFVFKTQVKVSHKKV